jgi:hypothetical protein
MTLLPAREAVRNSPPLPSIAGAAVAIKAAPAISPLKCFRLRCWARAYLHAAGEIDLQSAVDALQAGAVSNGLIFEFGQDLIQSVMVDFFKEDCNDRII